jgi:hypothetical protein
MKDLQLSLYDLISILFPSTLVLAILRYQQGLFPSDGLFAWALGNIWPTNTTNANLPSFASFTLIFVIAYLVGQVINLIAKAVESTPYVRGILFRNLLNLIKKPNLSGKMVFNPSTVPVVVKKQIGLTIIEHLSERYDSHFTPDEDLTDYLVQPLNDKAMAKRDIFIATAGMMRNMAVISLGFGVFFLIHALATALPNNNWGAQAVQNDWIYLGCSALSLLLFRYGFQKYRWYASRLMIFAFYFTSIQPKKDHVDAQQGGEGAPSRASQQVS